MTSEPPILRSDSPVVVALAQNIPKLALELLDSGLAMFPEVSSLPPDHFVDEVLPATIAGLTAALAALQDGHRLTREQIAHFIEPVLERHLEDGIPPQALVQGLGGALRHLWNAARAAATGADVDDLGAVGDELLYTFTQINCLITEIYSDVEGSFESTSRAARRALCAALVRGRHTHEEAARTGIPLAAHYLVVTLHIGERRSTFQVSDALVARKRMRLVQRHFDRLTHQLMLTDFDGTRGVILVPLPDGDEAGDQYLAGDLCDELSEQIDGLFCAARSVPADRIPGAAAECAEVANLAQIVGRPPGLYTIDDVMLEYQLSRPGPARDRLAQQVQPLVEQPHLLDALEVHLRHGGDRKSAAAELFVHPNTLTYRLRRIAEVTGISPMTPDGSRLLAAALMVQRLEGTSPAVS